MLCCVVLYGTVLSYTVLYCIVLYYTILHYTILCCTVLYYIILYCAVLYYAARTDCIVIFIKYFVQLFQEKLKVKTLDLRDSEMRCGELERDVESSYMKVPYVLMIMYYCAGHNCMAVFFAGGVFFSCFWEGFK